MRSTSPWLPAIVGGLLALATIAVAALLPASMALEWLTIVLAVVAAIYVGFALVDARRTPLVIEVAFASLTVLLAVGGLWASAWLLALGYALHGGWDVLHFSRRRVIATRLPWWYAVFCLTFDFPVAVYVVWRFAA